MIAAAKARGGDYGRGPCGLVMDYRPSEQIRMGIYWRGIASAA